MKSANPTAPPAEITWENPLIPDKRLRKLYTAMVELRLLESHLSRNKKSSGEEACRVSTALSLLPSDLTSDPVPPVATAFLRGAKLADLCRLNSKPIQSTELPIPADPATRLHLAIGAALALASKKKGPLVLAYIYPGDLTFTEWKPLLRLAGSHTAPILFVVLPSSHSAARPGTLSHASTASGVPGIPVDAADAVALYRVAQESMLRVRAGGGPVLMECVPFQLPGKTAAPADPVLLMQRSLLDRKIVTEAWLDQMPLRFETRLKAAIR